MDIKADQKAIKKPQPLSLPALTRAMTFLAEARQAKVTEATFAAYLIVLSDQPEADVLAACRSLAKREKRDFEAQMPTAGDILAECRRIRSQMAQDEPLKQIKAWEREKNLRLAAGDAGAGEPVPVAALFERPDFRQARVPRREPRTAREVRQLTPEEHERRLTELRGQATKLQGGAV